MFPELCVDFSVSPHWVVSGGRKMTGQNVERAWVMKIRTLVLRLKQGFTHCRCTAGDARAVFPKALKLCSAWKYSLPLPASLQWRWGVPNAHNWSLCI